MRCDASLSCKGDFTSLNPLTVSVVSLSTSPWRLLEMADPTVVVPNGNAWAWAFGTFSPLVAACHRQIRLVHGMFDALERQKRCTPGTMDYDVNDVRVAYLKSEYAKVSLEVEELRAWIVKSVRPHDPEPIPWAPWSHENAWSWDALSTFTTDIVLTASPPGVQPVVGDTARTPVAHDLPNASTPDVNGPDNPKEVHSPAQILHASSARENTHRGRSTDRSPRCDRRSSPRSRHPIRDGRSRDAPRGAYTVGSRIWHESPVAWLKTMSSNTCPDPGCVGWQGLPSTCRCNHSARLSAIRCAPSLVTVEQETLASIDARGRHPHICTNFTAHGMHPQRGCPVGRHCKFLHVGAPPFGAPGH